MKKVRTSVKLTVNRETLRFLEHQQSLREVGGGVSIYCSHFGTTCQTTGTKYC